MTLGRRHDIVNPVICVLITIGSHVKNLAWSELRGWDFSVRLSPCPEYWFEKQSRRMCSEGISVGQLWIVPICSWPGRQEEGVDFHIWWILSDLTTWAPNKIRQMPEPDIPPSLHTWWQITKLGKARDGGDLRGHLVLLRKEDQRGREGQWQKGQWQRVADKGLLQHPLEWAPPLYTCPVFNPPFSDDDIFI